MTKKITLLLILSALMIAFPAYLSTQTMFDYCSVSPFATRTVPANLTVIIDNSAAMLLPAYPPGDRYENSRQTSYLGYFDPLGSYCARTDAFYETHGRCRAGERGPYPGSLLNWATMSRYDLMMHLLIGGVGTPDPLSSDLIGRSPHSGWTKTTPHHPLCDFTVADQSLFITGEGCALENPGTKIVIRGGRKEKGLIPLLVDKNSDGVWDKSAPRISLVRFLPSHGDVSVGPCMSEANPPRALFRAIADIAADETYTENRLGEAIEQAIAFYAQSCPQRTTCEDPIDSIPCRKNIILVIGSGEATDIPHPYTMTYLTAEIGKSHTRDIRSDRVGSQTISYFAVNMFGSSIGTHIMMDISRYGGFRDMNGNGIPDLAAEWDRNSDGVPDTYFSASEPSAIRPVLERTFVEHTVQSASGTAPSFLPSDAGGVHGNVHAFFVPRQSPNLSEVTWTGHLRNVWVDQSAHLREDSIHDLNLTLDQDRIMMTFSPGDGSPPKVALFSTLSDGTGGTFSTCSNPHIKDPSEIVPLWDAGETLAMMAPSQRIIFTSKRILRGDRVVHAHPESPYPTFQTGMNPVIARALNPDSFLTADVIVRYVRGECLETGVSGDTECGNDRNPAFRDRRIPINGTLRVWKLGDIMNSSPTTLNGSPLNAYHLAYADRSYYDYIATDRYRSRSSIVFVGANDGMLHAFRGGYLQERGLTGRIKAILKTAFGIDGPADRLGDEIWAFIPFNAFPYLKYLAAPDYCHINYSDLAVKVVDVSLGGEAGAARNLKSWRTILLGGMRLGGACGPGGDPPAPPRGTPENVGYSSFFAIDVTIPEKPVPLWEFSDDNMGLATSLPAVVRVGDRTQNGKWYAAFGSGSKILPGAGTDIGRDDTGYIYILDLGTGDLVKKIALDHHGIVGDVLAADADGNYETERIYFGTAHKSGAAWMGKILRLDVLSALAHSDVEVSWNGSLGITLFSGPYPFTASPDAALLPYGSIWVYAGSGKYYSDVDETDSSRQIVVGLRDHGTKIGEGALFDATNVPMRGVVTETEKLCLYDPETDRFGLQNAVTSVKPVSETYVSAVNGWKISLSHGERVISRPAAIGGLVDFLTYRPSEDPCSYGGDSFLYSVNAVTGVAPARLAIRSPAMTSGTSGEVVVHKSIRLGSGAPPAGNAIQFLQPRDGAESIEKHVQVGTGSIEHAENRPLYSIVSKIIHWLKK